MSEEKKEYTSEEIQAMLAKDAQARLEIARAEIEETLKKHRCDIGVVITLANGALDYRWGIVVK